MIALFLLYKNRKELIHLITIYDLNRNPTAILENCFGVGYDKTTNALTTASFSMPADDPKVKHIKPLHYAEIIDDVTEEYIGMFRIMPKRHRFSSGSNILSYDLEHVLGTLFGKTLFKYHQFTNFTTRVVIERLLNMQTVKNWVLGDCEFTRYFHYSWENENLLSAILSIPEPFDESYEWVTDTTDYPWKLHLRKAETVVSTRAIQGYNLKGFTMEENPNALWNRVYPLGAGEGVNQVTIGKVNGGKHYVENTASIAKYGIYETTWADKRFEDATSLKASAESLLKKWSEPLISWDADVLDVSSLTGIEADKIRQGKVCRIQLDDYPNPIDLRVNSESKSDIFGDKGSMQVTLGNLHDDLGTTQADLERRQQVNELYSQGATNIMNFGYQDNCDNHIPALVPFYIDDDVVNVNTIELNFRTKKFRAYSGVTESDGSVVKSTSSGGGTVKSTSSGGGSTATAASGGGVTKTTESGGSTTQTSSVNGQSTQTSSAGGDHRHKLASHGGGANTPGLTKQKYYFGGNSSLMTMEVDGDAGELFTYESSGNHSHSVSTPAHDHSVSIPNHSHEFNVPNHTHAVTIPNHVHEINVPNHTHEIDIPAHTHDIKHQIVEAPNSASSVIIKIDGVTVPHTSTSGDRIDLANYLSKDSSGKITRGRHEITITPNTIARIEAELILRVFIRSQLGGNF